MNEVEWTIIKYYGWQCPCCDEWNETHEGKIMDDDVLTDLVVECGQCGNKFKLED